MISVWSDSVGPHTSSIIMCACESAVALFYDDLSEAWVVLIHNEMHTGKVCSYRGRSFFQCYGCGCFWMKVTSVGRCDVDGDWWCMSCGETLV